VEEGGRGIVPVDDAKDVERYHVLRCTAINRASDTILSASARCSSLQQLDEDSEVLL
jgi:hypothetical protein